MSEKLDREISKMIVRINNLIEEEEILVRNLEELKKQINELSQEPQKELRVKVAERIKDTINSIGRIEHIFSHILESYGEILVELELKLMEQ